MGIFDWMFGGDDEPQQPVVVPEPPAIPAAPSPSDAAAKAAAEIEAEKQKRVKTILTSPQGDTSPANVGKKKLLGGSE